jgi:hypothetical protein
MLAVSAASIATAFANVYDPAKPGFESGQPFYRTTIEPGITDAAAYVRRQAKHGDVFALAPASPDANLNDNATELASLTGVPAYLARASMNVNKVGPRRTVTEARLANLSALEKAPDYEASMSLLRRMGVRWFVWIGDNGPEFDPSLHRAAFSSRRAAVYDAYFSEHAGQGNGREQPQH